MAGTKMGSIKSKLGLRGKTKPGEMITRMNKLKAEEKKESKLSPKAYAKKEKAESPAHKKMEEKMTGKKHSTLVKKGMKKIIKKSII